MGGLVEIEIHSSVSMSESSEPYSESIERSES